MGFDWTTFALEAGNFVILVWILNRILYRPVLEAIESRRHEEAKHVAEVEALRAQAEVARREYEGRLGAWERDNETARARLADELAIERAKRLTELDAALEEERKKAEVLGARVQSERRRALERQAVAAGAKFVARLLDRIAGPDVEARLVDVALHELEAAPPPHSDGLRAALQDAGAGVKVVTAYRLDEGRRTAFTAAFSRLAGRPVAPVFTEDPVLRAGVCVVAGSWVVMADLRDELSFFSGMFDHAE